MTHGPFSTPGTVGASKPIIKLTELNELFWQLDNGEIHRDVVIKYFADRGIQFEYDLDETSKNS